MKASTKKFYSKGVDKQKRADISFGIKRIDSTLIQKWNTSERLLARAFIESCEASFIDFKKELYKFL